MAGYFLLSIKQPPVALDIIIITITIIIIVVFFMLHLV